MNRHRGTPVRLNRLSVVVVAAAAFFTTSPARAESVRLNTDVRPVSQAVTLRLDPGTADYTGTTSIALEVKEATSIFQFHAESIRTMTPVLRQEGAEIPMTYTVGGKGVVTCRTEKPLAPGPARLDIAFEDDFNTDAVGLYRMDADGVGYAFTQFEADDAREAFPCWDEPMFKIPYRLTLSVPQGQIAVANTPVETETTADGWTTFAYQETKPLPSYLLAIAAGPLETVDLPGLGVPGRVVTVKGASGLAGVAVAQTPPLLHALEEWFGRPYPYAKLDLIAVPEYWPGAMENAGAITFADNLLLLDPETVTVGQRRLLARVIAHELAHMWFGDLVTMEWWDDLWLNESFADWMGDKIADRVFPEFKRDLSTAVDGQEIMVQDALPSTIPIRRPVESTDNLLEDVGLAYNKGKSVLGMFEQWLGPETFRQGVVNYINANAWGNATAADLWAELDKVSGKGASAALAGFIEQPGVPFVTVESLGGGKLRLSQSRFHNLGSEVAPMLWQVPVGIRFAAKGKVETRTVLLDAASKTVDLGSDPGWVFPHADGAGYYRWKLDGDLMTALAAHTQDLGPRERIVCLGNFGALLLAGELDGGEYLAAIGAFADDSEPLVLTTLVQAMAGVRSPLVTDDLADAFALYVRQTLRPALDRFGLEPRPGEEETVPLLRASLIAWLGDEGQDSRVAAFARDKARAYLDDPASVDPAIVDACLRLAAQDGDQALFDEVRARAEAAATPTERARFLAVLGCFRNPAIQDEALRYALEGPLRPTEVLDIPRRMDDTKASRDRRFRWLTENFDSITGRLPGEFKGFMPFFAAGCSEERLDAAKAFFSDPDHQGPGTRKQLARVSELVGDCVALRDREGEAAARYLRGLHREP